MEKLEYKLAGKGVFVIIKLCRHNFTEPWDRLTKLDYESDQDKLLQQFNLTNDSSNLLLAEDLTNEPGVNNYDEFIDTFKDKLVEKDEENEEPAFVMFVLMSHGTINGGFLLSTPDSAKHPVKPCSCNSSSHVGKENCYVRYMTRDLMAKVDKAFDARREIPKIYIMQTCRGDAKNVMCKTAGDTGIGVPPSEIELFTLGYSNSFLFRPCVEGNGSWVAPAENPRNDGSFLIRYFCSALDELREAACKLEKNVKSLKRVCGSTAERHEFDGLIDLLGLENHTGGWLTNVCQRTTSLVANNLVKNNLEQAIDKQQPHYSSSLTYKFSCLKMLKTQWERELDCLDEWYAEMVEEMAQ